MAFEEKRYCSIFLSKYTIHVGNLLPPNTPDLRAHCAAKNKEIWNSTIPVNNNIEWNFCYSFFRRTLYFCHFFWGSSDASFDVFNSKIADLCYGNICYWEVRSDGMYLSGSNPPTNFKKMHDWNKPPHIA
ncbi:S-protein homolog 2-like [Primulina eburnea]|uniref:S-protein homolog 2-like n=1 Tax=Primulina eburnea TaxID=1245227 RepID=UPI003C6C01A7